jgi:phytoene/squalene synthetase
VPRTLVQSCGADERDLHRRRASPEWRAALAAVTARTRELFRAGRPLPNEVRGRLRWELRATWLGGMRILDRLESSGFDVFKSRPVLGVTDACLIASRTIAWRRGQAKT